MRYLLFCILILTFFSCDLSKYKLVKKNDFPTIFEKSKGKETATYADVIKFYQDLDNNFSTISFIEYGKTDSGKPLHLAVFDPDGIFDLKNLSKEKQVLLINNGIHPGESDGIDATMLLLRDLAKDSIQIPKNTIVATIPIYNIGGALNRNTSTRTNQNGPKSYGFRGNARNYDLNRDFIKADTKNTKVFYQIFHELKPDVFIDNHVSNGADYQYTLTHLLTQHNKLGGELGNYLHQEFMPALADSLAKKDWPITPYVNVFNESPEVGFAQFNDSPRYSTGYTTMFNTLGMMLETHMLKPYSQRVKGTYEFMRTTLNIIDKNSIKIKEARIKNNSYFVKAEEYYLNYEVDSSKTSKLQFKGYEDTIIKSKVTGLDRLRYNRKKPYTKEVNYYNYFKPKDTVTIPKAYIIPQGWWNVVNLLKLNHIEMKQLEKDSLMTVEAYHIEDYKTRQEAYEGHYPHFNTKVKAYQEKIKLRKDDYIITTQQDGIRYLLETLEPIANDSFFNWNFFDTVLQQKEHFSPYVFEEKALQILENDSILKQEFDALKQKDRQFRKNWYTQLDWIHKHSKHYEKSHLRYPIFRMLN
ncbi:M14 family metallopeptidase [Mesonia aestuariivivens]|uniref:M14 family metallopeptidase n=1 Tax=Mesonia aestuariivivens TaxID=2796128 RepID=A0ABS6W3M8_9FLAO|nr:M14 family metallopeptidase [Mesonia aestuariivivens]MBW2961738.1 M14 family metallopeptidase [Mesonia aestuariivivens]